jgi:hypothetical protein
MRVAFEELSSPLTGEGSGGGETTPLPPIPTFPRIGEMGNYVSCANRVPNTMHPPPQG